MKKSLNATASMVLLKAIFTNEIFTLWTII